MKEVALNIAGIQNLAKRKLLVDYLKGNDFDTVCFKK